MKLRADSLKRKTQLKTIQGDSLRKNKTDKRRNTKIDITEIQRIRREYYAVY